MVKADVVERFGVDLVLEEDVTFVFTGSVVVERNGVEGFPHGFVV